MLKYSMSYFDLHQFSLFNKTVSKLGIAECVSEFHFNTGGK